MQKVLMLSIDNLRYDCVAYQHDKRELLKHDVLQYLDTPLLNSIAEKSLCYTRCFSTSTYTTASHGSILTGLYPPRHGIRAFYDTRLHSDVRTIATALRGNGFRTVLYSDAPELFGPLGLNEGFDVALAGSDYELFQLMKKLEGEKVFLFCHLMDVHEPFMKCEFEYAEHVNRDYHDRVREMYQMTGDDPDRVQLSEGEKNAEWNYLLRRALKNRPVETLLPMYVQGIAKFDKGRLTHLLTGLDDAGFDDTSMRIFFSDHGEGRCFSHDKSYFGHGGMLFDNVLRVPLMVCHPDIDAGIDDRLISCVDIFPTIMEILGIDLHDNIDGIALLSNSRDEAYAEVWAADIEIIDPRAIEKEFTAFIKAQMALRTYDRKYVLWNKGDAGDFINEDASHLTNEEYVRMLYKKILGRTPDRDGVSWHVLNLESGSVNRKSILTDFIQSEEYRSVPKFSMYRLMHDPEEDRPVDGSAFPPSFQYFNRISDIDSHALKAEKIFSEECGDDLDHQAGVMGPGGFGDNSERGQVLSRLQDLGYL